jgi:hypothetical protein
MKGNGAGRIIFIIAGFLFVAALGFISLTGIVPLREGPSIDNAQEDGYRYFVRIMRRLGYRVTILSSLPEFSTPAAAGDAFIPLDQELDEAWEDMEAWVASGGRLFLPAESEAPGTWGPDDLILAEGGLEAAPGWEGGAAFPVDYSGWAMPAFSGSVETIAFVNGQPVFARAARGQGEIIYVSESAAFSNAAIRRGGPEYAAFLNGLFLPSRGGKLMLYRRREFIQAGRDPVRALFSGRFLPMSLQLIMAFAVFAAAAGLRFGRPQRLDPRAPRSTAAHLDAVGAFYARGRGGGMADGINAEYFERRAHLLAGLSPQAGQEALAARLARESGFEAMRIAALLAPGGEMGARDMLRRSAERARIIRALSGRRKK